MLSYCTFCIASLNHFLRRLSSSINKTMVVLASSSNMGPASASSSLNYASRSHSFSQFRGVIGLRSGKWGSRIAFNYKSFWLGAYNREEDAAMAYDRAAIKLQRSDPVLNFPIATYTVQETRFQAQYSNEEVLHMIRDQTYPSELANFLSDQSSARGFDGILNQNGGISFQLLFQKELTPTDVTRVKGFQIPREHAVQHFPPLTGESSGEKQWIELIFYDRYGRAWTFRYSFWKSTRTYVFTKGWRHFLNMNSLKARDSVIFYRCEHQVEDNGDPYFMIDVRRDGAESSGLMGPGSEILNRASNSVEVEESEEEETDEVMLFRVCIGKRKRRRTV